MRRQKIKHTDIAIGIKLQSFEMRLGLTKQLLADEEQ